MPEHPLFRILAVSVAVVVGGCSSEAPDTASPARSADQQRSVSFADAVTIAQAEVPDGVPFEVEIERLDGRDVIEVEFLVGSSVREVYIDPQTEDVLTVRDEDAQNTEQTEEELDQQAAMMSGAQVSLSDAGDNAADHAGGEALEVEYKVVDGALVAEVEVRTSDGDVVVHIDPTDGHVISSGPEGEAEEDHHEAVEPSADG